MFSKFKILIFSFLAIILFSQGSFAKSIKFVQISDAHYMLNEDGSEDATHSMSILKAAIADINGIPNVDFVIFSGDNIDKPAKELLYMFLVTANKLKMPYYVAIGDHELFKNQDFTRKDYMFVTRHISNNCHYRKSNYVFKKNGFVFIVLDGAKEVIPGSNGYYRKDTLDWLDKKLTKFDKKDVIILQHFPVLAPNDSTSMKTYNVQNYENVLAKHKNVIAIFSGHYHQNFEQKKDEIYHSSAPALIDEPHNYKIIEIEKSVKDKSLQIYTQLRHAE